MKHYPGLDASQPGLDLRVGPRFVAFGRGPLLWFGDMACHSHKADVCMNCQRRNKNNIVGKWRGEKRENSHPSSARESGARMGIFGKKRKKKRMRLNLQRHKDKGLGFYDVHLWK